MTHRLLTGALTLLLLVQATACIRRPSPLLSAEAPAAERAPELFRVRFETTRGPFVIEARRAWAPVGVDRFYQLARLGYYDGVRFFRVVDGFMVQFGIHGDPRVSTLWRGRRIPDDSVRQSNRRGLVTFAMSGPNTRTTQLFINYVDNARLDAQGFAPIGEVVEGMDVVDNFWRSYGEGAPRGKGPVQGRIFSEGEAYLARDFPRLERVLTTRVEARR